jgi:hypothetical protein
MTLLKSEVVVVGSFVVYGDDIDLVEIGTQRNIATLRGPLPQFWEVELPEAMALTVSFGEPGLIWCLSGNVVSGAVQSSPQRGGLSVPISCSHPMSLCKLPKTGVVPTFNSDTVGLSSQTRLVLPTASNILGGGTINKSPLTLPAASTFFTSAATLTDTGNSYLFLCNYMPAELFSVDPTFAAFGKSINFTRSPWYFYIRLELRETAGVYDYFVLGDISAQTPWNTPLFFWVSVGSELLTQYASGGQWGFYTRQTELLCPTTAAEFGVGFAGAGLMGNAYVINVDACHLHVPVEYETGNVAGSAQPGMQGRTSVIFKPR